MDGLAAIIFTISERRDGARGSTPPMTSATAQTPQGLAWRVNDLSAGWIPDAAPRGLCESL